MTYKKGDAHAVIIILLTVALVGALGWIFWQNLDKNKQTANTAPVVNAEKNPKSSDDNVAAVKTERATIENFKKYGVDISFSYPETWKVNHTAASNIVTKDAVDETTTVVSPDGMYTVSYRIGANGGLGGMCVPEENGTISSIAYEHLSAATALDFVELTTKNNDGTYSRESLLGQAGKSKNLKVNDTACATYMIGVVPLNPGGETAVTLLNASIKIKGYNDGESPDQLGKKDVASLDRLYSGKDYEAAKTILLSTTVK